MWLHGICSDVYVKHSHFNYDSVLEVLDPYRVY
jgi:hypothetical protein